MVKRVLLLLVITSLSIYSKDNFTLATSKLVYENKSVKGYSEFGRDLLLFPIIYNDTFITDIEKKKLVKPLKERSDNAVIFWYDDFLTNSKKDSSQIEEAVEFIISDSILDIPNYLSVFYDNDIDYLFVMRVKEAYTVKAKEYVTAYSHITLSGELWDCDKKGVVWRAEADVEGDNSTTDVEKIEKSVELLYKYLPKFYFNRKERSW